MYDEEVEWEQHHVEAQRQLELAELRLHELLEHEERHDAHHRHDERGQLELVRLLDYRDDRLRKWRYLVQGRHQEFILVFINNFRSSVP